MTWNEALRDFPFNYMSVISASHVWTYGFTIWDSDSSSVKPAFFFSLGKCRFGTDSDGGLVIWLIRHLIPRIKINHGLYNWYIGLKVYYSFETIYCSGKNAWNNLPRTWPSKPSHLLKKQLNQQKHIKSWIWSLKPIDLPAGPKFLVPPLDPLTINVQCKSLWQVKINTTEDPDCLTYSNLEASTWTALIDNQEWFQHLQLLGEVTSC